MLPEGSNVGGFHGFIMVWLWVKKGCQKYPTGKKKN